MKFYKILTIIIFMFCVNVNAQNISGSWKGVLSVQGQEIPLEFNIAKVSEGYTATMDSPTQGAKSIPVDQVTFIDNFLSIEIKAARFLYEGKLKDGKILGKVKQAGMELPLILNKNKATQNESRKMSIKDPSGIAGAWKGILSVKGQEIPLIFKLLKTDDGYKGLMDSPTQGATNIKVDDVIIKNKTLSIAINAFEFKYRANLIDGKFKGKVFQGGMELPLVLEKATSEEVSQNNKVAEDNAKFNEMISANMHSDIEDKIYTQEQIAVDVDFYIKTLEEVCPFPYLNTSKEIITKIANKIKAKPARSGKEVYLDFMELSAAYNTGHIYIMPAQSMMLDYMNNNGKIFPFKLKKEKNTWKIAGVTETSLEKYNNGRLYSINGIAIEKLIASLKPYTHSKRDEIFFANQLGSFLYFLNIKAPYKIKYSLEGSIKKQTITLAGVSEIKRPQSNSTSESESHTLSEFISFKMINDEVAYINAKSMNLSDQNLTKEYYDFVEQTFQTIEKKNAKHLIIDLRQNRGGHGHFAEELLSYFADKPYRQSAGGVRRVSQQFQDLAKYMPLAQRSMLPGKDGIGYLDLKPGTDIKTFGDPAPLKEVSHKFTGKVWCLIGNGTYSAAMMMANAIEDYDLATLVGESTGGVPNELSDVIPLKTPETKIAFAAPSVLFTRANGDAENPNPVQPAVFIKEDNSNKDMAIDYVLKQVKH